MPFSNLLADLPDARAGEVFTELLARPGARIERIVSHGQATPPDEPMVQGWDEWVLLLAGEAGLRIEEEPELRLHPGDHVLVPAGARHWVTFTASPTVWLAVHFGVTR
jgi:cupin 2 domain-containing protein